MSSDPQNNQSDRQCSLTLMIQIWISSTSVHIARVCESLEIRAQLSVNDACECFTVWWTLTASCSSSRCATTSVFLFDPPGLENWKAGEAISLLILQLKACEGGPLVADSRGWDRHAPHKGGDPPAHFDWTDSHLLTVSDQISPSPVEGLSHTDEEWLRGDGEA